MPCSRVVRQGPWGAANSRRGDDGDPPNRDARRAVTGRTSRRLSETLLKAEWRCGLSYRGVALVAVLLVTTLFWTALALALGAQF